MGIIIGPPYIFWLVTTIFSIKIGYPLLSELSGFSFIISIVSILVSIITYVYLSVLRFKHKKELYTFEIVLFFVLRKTSFLLIIGASLIHWIIQDYAMHYLIQIMPIALIFILSFGTLLGCFIAKRFMKRNNIRIYY